MANKKQHLTELVKMVNAKKFIYDYAKKHNGEMPEADAVAEAKVLLPGDEDKIDFQVEADALVKLSDAEKVNAEWDYIYNEASWNASYENGALKDYYAWADGLSPYKEDLWNTVENRAANWNDIEKDDKGVPIEYEDGYHYLNCVRCWKGAFYAPGAQYPWCGVKFSPFYGAIKFEYEDKEAYPWGKTFRQFKRNFGIASIPGELGAEYKCDFEGNTSFDSSKLNVTLFK